MRQKRQVLLRHLFTAILILSTCSFFSCGTDSDTHFEDGPTFGQIHVACDESFQPIFQSQIDVFHQQYNQARIGVRYTGEQEAMHLLITDSVRFALVSRILNQQETKYFEELKIIPKVLPIAYDAIAIIANPSRAKIQLTTDQLKRILKGELKDWNQINPDYRRGRIKVVFDSESSGIVRWLSENYGNPILGRDGYQISEITDQLEFVRSNPDAIAFVSAAWISDKDDSTHLQFLKDLSIVEVASSGHPALAPEYYAPYQAYIANKSYPMIRTWYIVSREARAGLGTGLASFLASERGQRIILKSGLVPATMPVRLVEIRSEQIQ